MKRRGKRSPASRSKSRPGIGDAGAIAVVGLGGVFPGAPDLATFERNTLAGVDSTREVPHGRWILDAPDVLADGHVPDKLYCTRACFVEGFALDPEGLNLDADLLGSLDPLYHLVLHAGRQAWRDGATAGLDRVRVGVTLAAIALPTDASSAITRDVVGRSFARALGEGLPPTPLPLGEGLGEGLAVRRKSAVAADPRVGRRTEAAFHGRHGGRPLRSVIITDFRGGLLGHAARNAQVTSLPAALLADALGLGGGNCTLDAACASSLYAIKLACEELRAGRADAMLAGGVSRPECLYTQVGFSQLRALSPSGCCRPFDAGADGLIVGEGAGLLLLKRLDDALRDGDRVYAVIRGVGCSNDIAGSLLAADSEGQIRAMRAAYEQVGWQPADVDYIECHGTGTPVGDAAEIESLRALWHETDSRPGQCPIGSVKSMVGHLLTAAGIAGVIRTILAMRAEKLPPTANFRQPAEKGPLCDGPFRVVTNAEPWQRRDTHTPRRAAVSAFGFGGINAHLLLEECDAAMAAQSGPARRRRKAKPESGTPIAIVGMEARVGALGSLREFQELVLSGGSAIRPRPADRWRGCDELAHELLEGRALPGAYLDKLAIDIGRYRLPPAEIPEVLPQQLLMLQVVEQALADAGRLSREHRPRAGVIVGIGLDLNTSNFHHRWTLASQARVWARQLGLRLDEDQFAEWVEALRREASPALNAGRVQGALGSIVASRVAREFGFGGPSFTVSAGEASGIRALEFAIRALQRGELDLAVAGAVDLAGDVRNVVTSNALRPYSRAGVARPFDRAADGTVVGEGAVALVLKRLPDALRDGDRVYAIARGLGFANGNANELPTATAYMEALQRAYVDADVAPRSISFIEAHGSGEPREDRLEAEALVSFFAGAGPRECALGSVKANIGHSGAAAGLASVTKAALALHHELLPPLSGYREPPAELDWNGVFHAPQGPQYWLRNRGDGPRRAGVSCMTLDGNCAHVVLEGVEQAGEGVDIRRSQPLGPRHAGLFGVDGDSVQELLSGLDSLEALSRREAGQVEHLAHRWHEGRPPARVARLALAIVADSLGELQASLDEARQALRSQPDQPIVGRNGIHFTPGPLGAGGQMAFVFPGSGNHYLGMGREVGARWPAVLRQLDQRCERLMSQLMPRWYSPWRADWPEDWEHQAAADIRADNLRMMMGQVAHGVVMSELLRHLGAEPQAAIGYSLGETTGMFALRAWGNRDEMLRRMTASPLFQTELAGPCTVARQVWGLRDDEPVDWRVAVLNTPAERVREIIGRYPRAYLLIVNTPDECVIGGRREQVAEIARKLDCTACYLDGASTVHCELVGEVEPAYRKLHLMDTEPPAGVRFYSPAWGRAYDLERESAADSILAQALHGFDFPAVIEQAYADGVRIFVEPGPGGSCCRMIDRILGARPHLAVPASLAGRDAVVTVLDALAALLTHRALPDLAALYGDEPEALDDGRPEEVDRPMVIVPTGAKPPRPKLPEPRRPGVVATASAASVPRPAVPVEAAIGEQLDPASDSLVASAARASSAEAAAHQAYLRFSQTATEGLGQAISLQARLIELMGRRPPVATHSSREGTSKPAFDRDMCMEFAVGLVARVLGPAFAEVDSHPIRVRLPDEPLMLVDRIFSVTGEKCSLTSGTITTEHDVRRGAWYLDADRCPTAITVEAGQADLFLCSYLGIDLAVKGTRAYRLLDATVTFHRGLPRPGDVIRYEIAIDRFVRQGDVYLFFFRFDGSIAGEPLLSMREGCAGFFTKQEIADSGGIVLTPEEREPAQGRLPDHWREPVPMAVESYDEVQIDALRAGDLAGCFGPLFDGLRLAESLRIPGGRMRLVHRVVEIDPRGGRYGIGVIRAEADIHPDDWFLTCHFVDDMVMPGTLMYECCLHTLRVYLLRMGWVSDREDVCCEPLPGALSKLRCRGPVTAETRVVTYEVQIKEIGYGPEPYVQTDAFMYADGDMIVRFTDMSLKLTGLTRAEIESTWRDRSPKQVPSPVVPPIGDTTPQAAPRPPIFDTCRILEFAIGKPSTAFGEPYKPFDRDRQIARLPGPPYQFLDRITEIHASAWQLEAGGWIEAQYDVPPNEWYFRANRQPAMPYCVLLEIALQPCGWLAAYLGSALHSEFDLRFRNLGGTAIQYQEVFADSGTLTTRVRLTKVAQAGGMIIQDFEMQVWRGPELVYGGTTSFGFFSRSALDKQVGIKDVDRRRHIPTAAEQQRGQRIPLQNCAPLTPEDPDLAPGPAAALPARALQMNDEVELHIPGGGPHGLGFGRAVKLVDPEEWFFKAHFHQDPVLAGSLGVESFLQLLKSIALERWGDRLADTYRFQAGLLGVPHTWVYRGQIVPANQRVAIEAVITAVRDGQRPELKANGLLQVDGLYIYELTDFGLCLVPVE